MNHPIIIIGLGNPGTDYELTRHNVGFLCADFIVAQNVFTPFTVSQKFHAEISENVHHCTKYIIAKPTTFMNRSGRAVQTLVDFYKVPAESIIVIHDDLDIPFGAYKISTDKNAAGHNGVQDIISALGTKEFTRIRIGIDNRSSEQRTNQSGIDYVLGRFTAEERDTLNEIFTQILAESPSYF